MAVIFHILYLVFYILYLGDSLVFCSGGCHSGKLRIGVNYEQSSRQSSEPVDKRNKQTFYLFCSWSFLIARKFNPDICLQSSHPYIKAIPMRYKSWGFHLGSQESSQTIKSPRSPPLTSKCPCCLFHICHFPFVMKTQLTNTNSKSWRKKRKKLLKKKELVRMVLHLKQNGTNHI